MSVTDLTGTTWRINDVPVISAAATYYINFVDANNGNYVRLSFTQAGSIQYRVYQSDWETVYDTRGWGQTYYQTITISGGTDVANTELISWLESNAAQVIEPYIPGNVYVDNAYLSDIAGAIRAKNGLSETYRPMDMGTAIDSLNLVGDVTADMIAKRDFGSSISGTVSSIYSYAFAYCSSLTTVSFPNCSDIGNYTFYCCSSLMAISFPNCTNIGMFAFGYCRTLTTVDFPNCISISNNGFGYCRTLITANLPNCISIGSNAFQNCSSLTTANFSKCSSIGNSAFYNCFSLTTASFPSCTYIGSSAFKYCFNLLSLYLNSVSSVTSLKNSAFYSTPIGGYTGSTRGVYGSVFVPSSLYSSFIKATNWTSISARIVSV